MSELKNKFAELKTKINEIQAEADKMASDCFHEGCKEIFEEHPKLQSWSWIQYTPYFNDGDTCEFDVNRDYLFVVYNDKEFEGLSDWSFKGNYKDKEVCEEEGLQQAVEDIKSFMDMFETNDYKNLFGDHVKVTVTNNGVKTDYYDHN